MMAKYLGLIILVVLFSEWSVQQNNNNDYMDESEVTQIVESNVTENIPNDPSLSEYDVDIAEEICAIDAIIDKLLPEDYEEGKLLNISTRVGHINQTFARIDRIIKLLNNYSNNLSPILQKVMARVSTIIYEISLPPECMASIAVIGEAFAKRQLWAMKFIDSMGGIPSGILEGVLSSVGEYNECLDIKSPSDSQLAISGQYCLAKPIIPHPERNSLRKGEPIYNIFSIPEQYIDEAIDLLYLLNGSLINIGICIPSTCRPIDVQNAINQIIYPLLRIPVQIGPNCDIKDKPIILDSYQITAILVLSTLFLTTILAAIYEYFIGSDKKEENPKNDERYDLSSSLLSQIIISFSIVSNTKSMFKKSSKKFVNIDFIRLLMLLQVTLMHQYYVYLFWSALPLTKRLFTGLSTKVGTDYKYAFLRNVHNTDFFFALSGLLTAYSLVGTLERSGGKFNYIKYLINIYLRFFPAIFGTILMYYLLPLVGTGPFWHIADIQYVDSCRKYLWPNLLSYNYYVLDLEEFIHSSMCNIASWWATTCFHLLVMAPLFIVPFYKSKNIIYFNLFLMIFGSILSLSHIFIKGIPVMNQLSKMNSILEESFYSIFYTWPFIHHISPFAVGIITGYLIRKMPNLYLGGKIGQTVLWFVFPGLTFWGFHWTQQLMKSDVNIETFAINDVSTELEVYLNLTFGKLFYCLGFLWIFYMCCTGRAAFLNRLLSWDSLTPIYRLSLGIYLANFLPPIYSLFSSKHSIELNDHLMLTNFAFNAVVTIILAYILHILFECPVLNILKVLQTDRSKSNNNNNNNNNNITKL